MEEQLPTLIATLFLGFVFLNPYPRHVIDERTPGYRAFASAAAGISVAYVFIDLLPELSGLGTELLGGVTESQLPYPEYWVNGAALLGFVLSYGLERLVDWSRGRAEREGRERDERDERVESMLKIGGSCAYVGVIAYLLVEAYGRGGEEGLPFYIFAMAFHFVALRHSLRFEFTDVYDHRGKWMLALSCLLGWMVGILAELPLAVLAPLVGAIGGMVIMNTTAMELPSENQGRFFPFVAGAVLYAALLMSV